MQEGLLQRWVGQGVGNTEGLGCGAGPVATRRLSDSKLQGQTCRGCPQPPVGRLPPPLARPLSPPWFLPSAGLLKAQCDSSTGRVQCTCESAGLVSCFPGAATVTLAGGATKRIADLALGDAVLAVGPDGRLLYAPVALFSSRRPAQRAAFLRVHTDAGLNITGARRLSLSTASPAPPRQTAPRSSLAFQLVNAAGYPAGNRLPALPWQCFALPRGPLQPSTEPLRPPTPRFPPQPPPATTSLHGRRPKQRRPSPRCPLRTPGRSCCLQR